MIDEQKQVYEFDEFRLDVMKRQLLRQGEVVPLYSKAFDLLLVMLQNGGRDLTKDELLETVWPGQMLEEANLTVNMSAVRKALGDKAAQPRYIVTIPGHGYRFVAHVREARDVPAGVIIETQTISQITVEQEETNDGLDFAPQMAAPPRPRIITWPRVMGGIAALIVIGLGGSLWLSKLPDRKNRFQQISIKRLTTTGTVSRAAISPDGKLFAYSIPEGDQESLWVGHVDGGDPIQIRPPSDDMYRAIRFSPDGGIIYYSVNNNDRGTAIFKIPVFGGAPEKLRDNFGSLAFSPDGKEIAFFRQDRERQKTILAASDINGGNEREIATMPSDISHIWFSPSWSPDGSAIVVAASIQGYTDKLFVVSVTDGSIRPLTSQGWRTLDGTMWLKDGSGLVTVGLGKSSLHPQIWFVSYPGGESRQLITDLNDYGYVTSTANDDSVLALQGISQSNIWVAPADNLKEAHQITFDSAGRNDGWNGLAWTNDGRIVFAADDSEGRTLWTLNATGGKPKQLIPNGGLNDYPNIAADGRYLVFQSNRSGHYAVWRSDLNGQNMTQMTGDQIAGQPSISPDGKWILYNSAVDGLGELFRIPSEGGEPFRLTDKPAGWAFVSPDSKLVACQIRIDGKNKLAILSLENGELLKSFDVPRLANPRLGVHWAPDGKAVSYRDWVNGIWRQELAGGEPHRLEGLPEEKLFAYSWSPDGKSFAFVRGATSRDVVLLKNEK